jgi:hypothetical protein
MACVGVPSPDFSASGQAESFRCRFLRLYFHFTVFPALLAKRLVSRPELTEALDLTRKLDNLSRKCGGTCRTRDRARIKACRGVVAAALALPLFSTSRRCPFPRTREFLEQELMTP